MDNSQQAFLLECRSYDSYLDHFIKRNDFYYLRNGYVCRELVTLGYRSTAPVYSLSEFYEKRKQMQDSLNPTINTSVIFSEKLSSSDHVLKALAKRETLNQQKIISTIIFLKCGSKSAFIDYQQSLNRAYMREIGATDWARVFEEEINIHPKKTDLSYYDWRAMTACYNNSDNYQVIHHRDYGLIFMYRSDNKRISVDMTNRLSSNCRYEVVFSKKYGNVVFMDHVIRKKL